MIKTTINGAVSQSAFENSLAADQLERVLPNQTPQDLFVSHQTPVIFPHYFNTPPVFQAYFETSESLGLPPLSLVKRPPQPRRVKEVLLEADMTQLKHRRIPDIDEFINVIFDASSYPLDATYLDGEVMLDSFNLGSDQGYELIYECTGAPPGGESRHFIMAMRIAEQTDSKVKIEWYSLSEDFAKKQFPDVLAMNPDAVYTPYNHGAWTLDLNAKKISYQFDVDPGGRVPLFLIEDELLFSFPKKLMLDHWGILFP